MSFFEPMPTPEPQAPRHWAPPAWDRPSEGTLPAIIPVGEIVHRGENVVVELEALRVYPNGFTINLFILTNPHVESMRPGFAMRAGAGSDPFSRFPRIGVRFADGRTAGRDAPFFGAHAASRDDAGIPTEPVLTMTGGGGGSNGFHFGAWVFPLPPDGPLEIYVSLPASGVNESKVTLDGGAVRAAAGRATVIWS
jgi:hypothetical protein